MGFQARKYQKSNSLKQKAKIFLLGSKVPDWKAVRDHLVQEGKITKEHFVKMINGVTDIFS